MQHMENTNLQYIACEECGLVSQLPSLDVGTVAYCGGCGHVLTKRNHFPYQKGIALSLSCLIMLVLSLAFPFMSFSVQGLKQEIYLLHAAQMLTENHNALLGTLLFGSVVFLPAIYTTLILYLHIKARQTAHSSGAQTDFPTSKRLSKLLFIVQPWLMVDVFLIGVLVSLIKIASLADVAMGYSFWAFCGFAILLVKNVAGLDRYWLWQHFSPNPPLQNVTPGDNHLSQNHVSCPICQAITEIDKHNMQKSVFCSRCHTSLTLFNPHDNLQKCWALLISAAIFFIPANLYPMMYTVSLGNSEGSTILQGVVLLWHLGSYPIAAVIFMASIFIPMAKMFALGWLYYRANQSQNTAQKEHLTTLRVYRITELIGRWSMIDIFVVAILVALVQLQNVMAIYPGPAALSFAAVVILTMLSAMMFDPRSLNRPR